MPRSSSTAASSAKRPSHGDTPFLQRPVAAELSKRLVKGDVIIVTSVDRAFRNFADCFLCLADWHSRGIILYPIEFGIDTSTDAGLMVVQIRAAVAQYELSLIRKRTKRILKMRKDKHGFTNQFPGYGWKLVGPEGKRRRVPDEKERAQMRAIVRMHDRLGLSLEAIYLRFFRRRKRTRQGKLWSYDRIKRAYQAAKKISNGGNGTNATEAGCSM